ncbi:hypothetical protein [Spirabiliibacterium mucosae]|uniref:hypothetical protein n=1 Tax=Spirabiliibacterium mucosae TaxID=28156 RepID=UPI0031F39C75
MDYIETIAVERLKKVIAGEQGGISKAVGWQGGGEFVYAEFAPFNETARQRILACENFDELSTFFNTLCQHYFLDHHVSVAQFTQLMTENDYKQLSLDEQKQMMIDMLDLNQLYINLSDQDDSQFDDSLSDEDKRLSLAFYGEKS